MVRGNRDALKLLARALEETELAHGNLTRGLELLEPVLEVVPTQASEALQKAADIREESGSLKGANEAIDLLRVLELLLGRQLTSRSFGRAHQ